MKRKVNAYFIKLWNETIDDMGLRDRLIESGFNDELSTREKIIFAAGLFARDMRKLKKLGLCVVFKNRKPRSSRTLH